MQLLAEDHAAALDSLEEAERVYPGAMPDGDEMEAWRDAPPNALMLAILRASKIRILAFAGKNGRRGYVDLNPFPWT